MKVLFVTIHFGEYIAQIKNSIMQDFNADVDLVYTDNSLVNPVYTLDKMLFKKIRKLSDDKYQRVIFEKYRKTSYDVIFVLVGRNMNIQYFTDFLDSQPDSYKVLYLWDDVKRVENFDRIKNLFDKIYSFDSKDCEQYGLVHLPLFYCDCYSYCSEEKKIDMSSVGGLHSYRYQMLKQMKQFCRDNQYSCKLYLKTTLLHYCKMAIQNRFRHMGILGFGGLSLKKNAQIIKSSKVVIDMPFESQNGLTIRTLEALAARAKLATTNRNIINYNFYDPRNILVIDRNTSSLPREFLESDYRRLSDDVLNQYSIHQWIKKLLNGSK